MTDLGLSGIDRLKNGGCPVRQSLFYMELTFIYFADYFVILYFITVFALR